MTLQHVAFAHTWMLRVAWRLECEEVNIAAECAKGDSCPYWKEGKEEFLSNFNLQDLDTVYVPRVNELYSFRHVFHDERHPEQFRKGIKMAPLVIKRVPGKTPRSVCVRCRTKN